MVAFRGILSSYFIPAKNYKIYNMRPAYLVMIFVVMFGCFPSTEGIKNDSIIELLEELRVRMCHPIDKWGLPALDPFKIDHMEQSTNNQYLRDFTASVTDLRLTGPSDFIINEIMITTFPLQRFIFDLTFPLTMVKSIYTAKGSFAYIVNLTGDGDAKVSVEEVRIRISGNLRLGLTVGIRNLKIMITIGGIEVFFEKLIEEERINDFVHALINELGIELLNDVWEPEQKVTQDFLQKKINDFLSNYTLSDIIAIIGGAGGPIFGPEDPPGDCKNDS